jgi:hypothetical protein
MAKLADVLLYICQNYPHRDELSKARITKMVYLADWKAAIETRQQITPIQWRFDHYGPWVDDVVQTARSDSRFKVRKGLTFFGNDKDVISLVPGASSINPELTADEVKILDFMIQATEKLTWNDFIKLIYSTYPIMSEPRYSSLDLVTLANDYQIQQEDIGWNSGVPLLAKT